MNPLQQLPLVPSLDNEYFKNVSLQNFHFQQPLIHYLLKNSKSKVLQKLHKCCKKLFINGKIAICKNLTICSSIKKSRYSTRTETLYLSPQKAKAKWCHRIFVYGTFNFTKQHQNSRALSAFISQKLHLCEVESVYAESQDITSNEFKLLLSLKTKSLIMKNCIVQSYGGLYDYVKRFPSLHTAKFQHYCSASENSSSHLWWRSCLTGELLCHSCRLYYRLNYGLNKGVEKSLKNE